MISFTGSTGVGRHIGQVAAKNIKKVSLEVNNFHSCLLSSINSFTFLKILFVAQMGGKNAAIVYDDADLSKAIPSVINSCFLNQGTSPYE